MLLDSLNSFIESTCVIVVFAYILTRNPLIALFSREKSSLRDTLILGVVLGLAGLVELYFAQNRFPYDTYALIVTFAALRGGWKVGCITAGVVGTGAYFFLTSVPQERTLLFILVALCAGLFVRSVLKQVRWGRGSLTRLIISSLVAVLLADSGSIIVRNLPQLDIPQLDNTPFSGRVAVLRFFADGLGIILLQLILNDAQARIASERFQVEAARGRTLLVEAKLLALRARIHPHFLFNALTTIAALCRLDAVKAEAATIQLAQIMRRALEADKRVAQPLGNEIEYVTDYVEIEKLRLGSRLHFEWRIDGDTENTLIPAFVLQTLVENAIHHGISPKLEPGRVVVIVRKRSHYVLVAICDDGVGISRAKRCKLLHLKEQGTEPHGIVLANEQLELLYGPTSRLRLFSGEDKGTLVAFRLPVAQLSAAGHLSLAQRVPSESPINLTSCQSGGFTL